MAGAPHHGGVRRGGARGRHARTGLDVGGSRRRASGTLPNDWYTSPRALRPRAAHAVPRGLALRRARRPGGRAGPVLQCEVADEQVVVSRGRDGELRALSNVCLHRAGPWRWAAVAATPSSARTTAGRSSSTAGSASTQGMDGTVDFDPARCACPHSRSAFGARRSGSRWSPACRSRVARRRHAAAGELRHGRDALRRRTSLDDRLQLEDLRRQLHGGLPHPLHPSRARAEPQPVGLHLPARALLERAVRRRAAPARPRLAGRRHPRRRRRSSARSSRRPTASTSPSARATTSTGSSR